LSTRTLNVVASETPRPALRQCLLDCRLEIDLHDGAQSMVASGDIFRDDRYRGRHARPDSEGEEDAIAFLLYVFISRRPKAAVSRTEPSLRERRPALNPKLPAPRRRTAGVCETGPSRSRPFTAESARPIGADAGPGAVHRRRRPRRARSELWPAMAGCRPSSAAPCIRCGPRPRSRLPRE
jgi:hypothetical protein